MPREGETQRQTEGERGETEREKRVTEMDSNGVAFRPAVRLDGLTVGLVGVS